MPPRQRERLRFSPLSIIPFKTSTAAAVLFRHNNPAGQKYLACLERSHGQGKALTVLVHTLARAVYDMVNTTLPLIEISFSTSDGAGRASLSPRGPLMG